MNINLLNLKSRLDSYSTLPTASQVLAWNSVDARFEPVSLKTAGGSSLLGSGALTGGDKASFFVVDLAAGSPIALSGNVTLDGVSTLGKSVLVYGQTDQKENGLYSVDNSGVWTRNATNFELFGRYVFVHDGIVDRNKFFLNTNVLVPTYGTDAITFQEKTFQNKLISGTNIKTVNGSSLLGTGNLVVNASPIAFGNILTNLTLDTAANLGDVMYLKSTSTLVACKNNSGGTGVRLGILVESGLAGETKKIATIGSMIDASGFGSWVPNTTYYVQAGFTISSTVNGVAFAKAITSSLIYLMEP